MPPRRSVRAKASVNSNAERISATAKIPTRAAAPVKQAAVRANPPPRLPRTLSLGTLTPSRYMSDGLAAANPWPEYYVFPDHKAWLLTSYIFRRNVLAP